ncbi:unnamed protein product, partial [Owenia fusiformis]
MKWICFILLHILQLAEVSLRKLEPRRVTLYIGGQTQFKCSPEIPENHTIVGLNWELTGYHEVLTFVNRKQGYDAKTRILLHLENGEIQGLVSSFVGQHKSHPRYYFHKKGNNFTMLIQSAKLDDAGEIACVVYINNDATDRTSTIKSTAQLIVLPEKTPVQWAREGKYEIIPCRVPNYLPNGWMTEWVRLLYYNNAKKRKPPRFIFMISNSWRFYKKHWTTIDSVKYELMQPESPYIYDIKIKHVRPSDAGYYVCNIQIEKIHTLFEDSEGPKDYYFPVQMKIKGTPKEPKCKCSKPKHMLSKDGDTLFTNGLNCGSRVEWRCRDQSFPVFTEPVPYQTCVNGTWEPQFEGLPWCMFYTKGNPCIEFQNRKICKQDSRCYVDGESSDATCRCKENTKGVFCEKTSS